MPLRTVVGGTLAHAALALFLRISVKWTPAELNAFDLVETVTSSSTLPLESAALSESAVAFLVPTIFRSA